ncbi:NYN domain-containing protein [Celeribacter sp. PS-C1]|uniref:NYN domain-containing protein n=1 Tax=Celeribacter sp. PS-C1 TaxID=2820813 RepID=UPI001C6724EA|nr:NYN domain-containing protein [Celeribacter sp. PS-C1]MBW6417514.1 NYN domain-containing protein [Celeribacter sp. PS-C1]
MAAATKQRLLAVLIDADNVSAKHAEAIFEEIAAFGEASVRRIYGDFSGGAIQGWTKDKLAEHAIIPRQQFANTTKKNASDIALVIDAMDLLHTGRFNGFVLISSDSDFTSLASRVREQGMDAIGMGLQKTPVSFRNACNRFIYLENLENDEKAPKISPDKKNVTAPATKKKLPSPKKLIETAMDAIDQEDDWYLIQQVHEKLRSARPDFDPRSYGHKKMVSLVDHLNGFETKRNQNNQPIMRKTG